MVLPGVLETVISFRVVTFVHLSKSLGPINVALGLKSVVLDHDYSYNLKSLCDVVIFNYTMGFSMIIYFLQQKHGNPDMHYGRISVINS